MASRLQSLIIDHQKRYPGASLRPMALTFEEPQALDGSKITCPLDFSQIEFRGGLVVSNCTFSCDVDLSGVETGGAGVQFSSCEFGAGFRVSSSSLLALALRSTKFAGGFTIRLPQGSTLDLRGSSLAGNGEILPLEASSGMTGIRQLVCNDFLLAKESALEICGFAAASVDLSRCVVRDKAGLYLRDMAPGRLVLNGLVDADRGVVVLDRVELSGASFSGTNLEKFQFLDVQWPARKGRVCLPEELAWRDQLNSADKKQATASEEGRLKIAELYRQLVLNTEAKRNYLLAEDFYAGEMEMLRMAGLAKPGGWLGRLSANVNIYAIYRYLSFYGCSYIRAISVLLVAIVLFSAVFMLVGIRDKSSLLTRTFEYSLVSGGEFRPVKLSAFASDAADALALTFALITLQKDAPLSPIGRWGSLVAAVLVISASAQAALVLFAIRRRFRRASL